MSQPQPTQDPSHVCNLHHSSQQRQILNSLSEARDQTRILIDIGWVLNPLSHDRNSLYLLSFTTYSKNKNFSHKKRIFNVISYNEQVPNGFLVWVWFGLYLYHVEVPRPGTELSCCRDNAGSLTHWAKKRISYKIQLWEGKHEMIFNEIQWSPPSLIWNHSCFYYTFHQGFLILEESIMFSLTISES